MMLTQTYNFATQHMKSAYIFAQQAQLVEERNAGQEFGPFFEKIRTFVSSTIIMSVCALEANINEHFRQKKGILRDFSEDQRITIFRKIEKLPVLDKYQLGLLLNKRDEINFNTEPFESLQYLVLFRNMMVHFKSEYDSELEYSGRLEKKLRAKITQSPFTKTSPGFLTHRAMSFSCARWSANTVLQFSRDYCKRLGILDKFRSIELI